MARVVVVLLGLLTTLAVASPASAHVGGGAAGSDYDARIVSVTPEVPGVTVRILQFGDEFELVNETSTDVVVPGYSDEPYLRIGPDGVWRNANSPASGFGASANQPSIAGSSWRWMPACRLTPWLSAAMWRSAAAGSS